MLIVVAIALMILISLFTRFIGVADIGDYADTAKFFAGDYQAKLRSSHSVLYGLIMSPFVKLTSSFIFLKIASLFWLLLLILSIYYISNKNKKTLLLIVTAPIVWYIAPWITPASLLAFLFLWGYYFIERFDKQEKTKYLIYSGLLIGFASAIWTTALYLSFFLLISYLYNKKFIFSWIFLLSLFFGILPTLIVDQLLFNFPFYSIVKHISSAIVFFLFIIVN